MDHLYIDEERIPERYVTGRLAAPLRDEFEAHLVDCVECSDRLLLAEMFHAHNGLDRVSSPLQPKLPEPDPLPVHARIVARFRTWQFALILGAAAILLLSFSTIIYLWELNQR